MSKAPTCNVLPGMFLPACASVVEDLQTAVKFWDVIMAIVGRIRGVTRLITSESSRSTSRSALAGFEAPTQAPAAPLGMQAALRRAVNH